MFSQLHASWWQRLGADVPIINAPMGGVAGGRLAAAVSRAGALGTLGMGSSGSFEALTRELALYRGAGGDGRFGIGLVDWGIAKDPSMLDRALDARPTLLSVSFGDFSAGAEAPEWIARANHLGIATVTQVATAAEAEQAVLSGIDAVVARGLEAGGHGAPEHDRDSLLTSVLDRVAGRVPVLAAGAISTRDDLAAAMSQGAAGGWIGTAFTACPESLTNDTNRATLLAAGEGDTHITREFDIALGLPWPERFPERVIRESPVNAGMGIGALTEVRTAAQVVDSFRL
ncbi:nitronate monooxygenase [Leucobacter chinensis]|uniref:nitronate monooxygenase n=1 Tax=Leucobacter chinensis TaxID=2851010 RepID=UPI001C229E4D|nr:nitronate monooxygenase [Leucobacter chinensis]